MSSDRCAAAGDPEECLGGGEKWAVATTVSTRMAVIEDCECAIRKTPLLVRGREVEAAPVVARGATIWRGGERAKTRCADMTVTPSPSGGGAAAPLTTRRGGAREAARGSPRHRPRLHGDECKQMGEETSQDMYRLMMRKCAPKSSQ